MVTLSYLSVCHDRLIIFRTNILRWVPTSTEPSTREYNWRLEILVRFRRVLVDLSQLSQKLFTSRN